MIGFIEITKLLNGELLITRADDFVFASEGFLAKFLGNVFPIVDCAFVISGINGYVEYYVVGQDYFPQDTYICQKIGGNVKTTTKEEYLQKYKEHVKNGGVTG